MSFRNLLLLAGVLGAVTSHAAIKAGDVFPSLRDAGLPALSANGLAGLDGKVVLVDFWASWCAPCKASFPAMAKLHGDLSARGLVIVAISVDEQPAAAAAFWKRMAVPFVGLHDQDQAFVKRVTVPAMPTSYLLDRQGRVRFVHEGFHGEKSERELRRQIESLLVEKS